MWQIRTVSQSCQSPFPFVLANDSSDAVKLPTVNHDEEALTLGALRPELANQIFLARMLRGAAIAALVFDDENAAVSQQAYEIRIEAIGRSLQPKGMRLP